MSHFVHPGKRSHDGHMMTVSVYRLKLLLKLLKLLKGCLALREGLGGRCMGPEGVVILAVGAWLAHLDGGRWFAGRAGREKLLVGTGDGS